MHACLNPKAYTSPKHYVWHFECVVGGRCSHGGNNNTHLGTAWMANVGPRRFTRKKSQLSVLRFDSSQNIQNKFFFPFFSLKKVLKKAQDLIYWMNRLSLRFFLQILFWWGLVFRTPGNLCYLEQLQYPELMPVPGVLLVPLYSTILRKTLERSIEV